MKSRRRFTRRGFIAGAGALLASGALAGIASRSAFAQQTADKKAGADSAAQMGKPLLRRKLGRTGLELPIVSMGVMNANNPALVRAAYERGMRHFDTAAVYQFGRNEMMVGQVVKEMGIRDKVVIATKILPAGFRRSIPAGQTRVKFMEALDWSLKRLEIDCIDVLYVHDVRAAADVANEEIIEAMVEARKAGKIRFPGVSTHSNMAAVIDAVASGGFYDVVLASYNFTLADDAALAAAIKNAAAKGVGIVAMKTLAGGDRWPNEETRKGFAAATVTSAALKWALRNESVATAIPGFVSIEELDADMGPGASLALTPDEERFLSDNRIKLGMGFCRQCRLCLASCPRGADVPALVRAHMYARQYGDFWAARAAIGEAPRGRSLDACRLCGECAARCSHSVDIPSRIAELKCIAA